MWPCHGETSDESSHLQVAGRDLSIENLKEQEIDSGVDKGLLTGAIPRHKRPKPGKLNGAASDRNKAGDHTRPPVKF